ncbi:MAG: hypothetical protein R2737_17735 [Candidatus Nanopelagicales bacterium]
MNEKKAGAANWISIVLIVVGALMMVAGTTTYAMVGNTLADERITVSEDACLGGQDVNGPFTAYCEAMIIEQHAIEATGGKTYAELDREDPLRAVAMNGSFLRASLFTSVVAFGVSALVVGLGVLFILVGVAVRSLMGALGVRREEPAEAATV